MANVIVNETIAMKQLGNDGNAVNHVAELHGLQSWFGAIGATVIDSPKIAKLLKSLLLEKVGVCDGLRTIQRKDRTWSDVQGRNQGEYERARRHVQVVSIRNTLKAIARNI